MSKTHLPAANPQPPDSLCALYEALRGCALGVLETSAHVYGLGVLLLKGMATWMDSSRRYAVMDVGVEPRIIESPARLSASEQSQLSGILAEIVIRQCCPEVS